MSIALSKNRNVILYLILILFSTAIGIAGLVVYFYVINLARNSVDFASSNPIALKIGRIGYLYSHASVQYACGRYDPELAYLMRPGECVQDDVEFRLDININSAGLRDDEESIVDPDIVLLGDSHAMGLGVAEDEIFAAIVERGAGLKVLNAGVSSYGTVREMMLLRRLGLDRTKYVILQYCRNDIDENMAYYYSGGRLEIMPKEEFERNARFDVERHRTFLWPGLGVADRFFEKIQKIAKSLVSDAGNISEIDFFKYVITHNLDILEGRKITLLDINGHINYDNNFIENAKRTLADLPPDIEFIDASQFLEDDDFFVLDNQMRPRGHKKVADAILQAIRQDPVLATPAVR